MLKIDKNSSNEQRFRFNYQYEDNKSPHKNHFIPDQIQNNFKAEQTENFNYQTNQNSKRKKFRAHKSIVDIIQNQPWRPTEGWQHQQQDLSTNIFYNLSNNLKHYEKLQKKQRVKNQLRNREKAKECFKNLKFENKQRSQHKLNPYQSSNKQLYISKQKKLKYDNFQNFNPLIEFKNIHSIPIKKYNEIQIKYPLQNINIKENILKTKFTQVKIQKHQRTHTEPSVKNFQQSHQNLQTINKKPYKIRSRNSSFLLLHLPRIKNKNEVNKQVTCIFDKNQIRFDPFQDDKLFRMI